MLLLIASACCNRSSVPGTFNISSAYIAKPAIVNTHSAMAIVSTFIIGGGGSVLYNTIDEILVIVVVIELTVACL